MGFFRGLATGLAEGSTEAIKNDMTRRQKQIDEITSFAAGQRADQLADANEHDASVEELFTEISNDLNGDNVAALAAWNAAGGTLSSVTSFMEDYRNTKGTLGDDYKLSDKLSLKGLTYDRAKFGDINFDDALESLYKDVPTTEASDIQYQDTGLLSKIGLGRKDEGKSIADQVNALIPGREAGEDYNISGATLDRTGMLSQRLFEEDLRPKNFEALEAGLYSEFTKAPDGPKKEAMGLELDRLKKYRDEGNNNFTSTELYRGYSTVLSNFNQKIKDMTNDFEGYSTMTIDDVVYSSEDGTYAPKVAELKAEEFRPWVGRTLVGSDASVTSEAQNFINNFDFGDIANEFVTERSKQPEGGAEGGGATVLTDAQKDIPLMLGDPEAYIVSQLDALGDGVKPADTESILRSMRRPDVYKGLSTQEIVEYDRKLAAYEEANAPKPVVETTAKALKTAATGQERFDLIVQNINTVEIDNARIAKLAQDIKSNESAGTTGSGLTAGLSRFTKPNVYATELVQSVFEELGVDIKVTKRNSPEEYAELEKIMLGRVNKSLSQIEDKEKADRENIETISTLN